MNNFEQFMKENFININKKELDYTDVSRKIIYILVNQQSRKILLPYKMNQYLNNKYFKENIKDEIIKYIANKSGKWESARNYGGIISTICGDYILVILIKDFEDKNLLNDKVCSVGSKISELVFDEYVNSMCEKLVREEK